MTGWQIVFTMWEVVRHQPCQSFQVCGGHQMDICHRRAERRREARCPLQAAGLHTWIRVTLRGRGGQSSGVKSIHARIERDFLLDGWQVARCYGNAGSELCPRWGPEESRRLHNKSLFSQIKWESSSGGRVGSRAREIHPVTRVGKKKKIILKEFSLFGIFL